VEGRRPYDIDSLTDVALRVFAERGYDGASMDDVARAAGITKASIYHHVAGKEALLERGLERALAALAAILGEPAAQAGSDAQRVRFIVRRVAETACSLLPELTVLFRLKATSPATEQALERRRAFDRAVARLIAGGQACGRPLAPRRAGAGHAADLRRLELDRRVVPARRSPEARGDCGGARGPAFRGTRRPEVVSIAQPTIW
jgi:AcrR family transcriptional regulator